MDAGLTPRRIRVTYGTGSERTARRRGGHAGPPQHQRRSPLRRFAVLVTTAVLLLGLALGGEPLTQAGAQGATPASLPGASPAGCPTTTPEQNVALVRQWYDKVYNGRDTGLIPSLLAPDYVRHRPGAQVPNQPGPADDIRFVKLVLTEFPDLHVTVNDVVAAGDQVAIRTTFAGTQRAPLTDQGGAPATNRRMSRDNIAIWRVACGRLAEQWIVSDFLTELRQLGIISNAELASIGPPSVATPAAVPPVASPVALTPAATSAAVGSPAATCPTTTPDQNEAIARRWFEDVWNGRDLALADAVLADNVMFHYPGRPDLNPTSHP